METLLTIRTNGLNGLMTLLLSKIFMSRDNPAPEYEFLKTNHKNPFSPLSDGHKLVFQKFVDPKMVEIGRAIAQKIL
jgi:hypothetical protein